MGCIGVHEKAVRRLQFDQVKVVTGGDDRDIYMWDVRMGLKKCALGNSELALMYIPTYLDRGRVSAMQYDSRRLICAFTLGRTTAAGVHERRGCIKEWTF